MTSRVFHTIPTARYFIQVGTYSTTNYYRFNIRVQLLHRKIHIQNYMVYYRKFSLCTRNLFSNLLFQCLSLLSILMLC